MVLEIFDIKICTGRRAVEVGIGCEGARFSRAERGEGDGVLRRVACAEVAEKGDNKSGELDQMSIWLQREGGSVNYW